jgi:hypothetical protein
LRAEVAHRAKRCLLVDFVARGSKATTSETSTASKHPPCRVEGVGGDGSGDSGDGRRVVSGGGAGRDEISGSRA